jgi:hypothetical protein
MMVKDSLVRLVFGGKKNVWIHLIITMNLTELCYLLHCLLFVNKK